MLIQESLYPMEKTRERAVALPLTIRARPGVLLPGSRVQAGCGLAAMWTGKEMVHQRRKVPVCLPRELRLPPGSRTAAPGVIVAGSRSLRCLGSQQAESYLSAPPERASGSQGGQKEGQVETALFGTGSQERCNHQERQPCSALSRQEMPPRERGERRVSRK